MTTNLTITIKNPIVLLSIGLFLFTYPIAAYGFSVHNQLQGVRPPTRVFLKDNIADMIDKELLRLQSKNKVDEEVRTKTQKFMQEVQPLPRDYDFNGESYELENGVDDSSASIATPSFASRKDIKMAADDPQRYCADRCVTTGNCEVFEDLYSLSPEEVMSFCKDCVLSDDEEPCDVPDAMYEGLGP